MLIILSFSLNTKNSKQLVFKTYSLLLSLSYESENLETFYNKAMFKTGRIYEAERNNEVQNYLLMFDLKLMSTKN